MEADSDDKICGSMIEICPSARQLSSTAPLIRSSNEKASIGALLNTGMNSSFWNDYKPSRVSFVTSSEKLIHTMNQQRR